MDDAMLKSHRFSVENSFTLTKAIIRFQLKIIANKTRQSIKIYFAINNRMTYFLIKQTMRYGRYNIYIFI